MMPDEFDEEEPELDDEVDLDDDDLALDDEVDEVEVVVGVDVVDKVMDVEQGDTAAAAGEELVKAPRRRPRRGASGESGEEDEDDVVDLEEELHPDDVEDALDVLLKERTAADRLDEEEAELEDEELEVDDRGDGSGKIVPRRHDEFLCRSCFLVKPLSQLARGERNLCRDCE